MVLLDYVVFHSLYDQGFIFPFPVDSREQLYIAGQGMEDSVTYTSWSHFFIPQPCNSTPPYAPYHPTWPREVQKGVYWSQFITMESVRTTWKAGVSWRISSQNANVEVFPQNVTLLGNRVLNR